MFDELSKVNIYGECNFIVDNFFLYLFYEENLPETKQLYGGIFFVDSIPMTPSGKVLRRRAKDLAIELYTSKNKTQCA